MIERVKVGQRYSKAYGTTCRRQKGHGLPIQKMVSYVLLRPLRLELDGQDQVQILVTLAIICSD
jgi:hypothetical protein